MLQRQLNRIEDIRFDVRQSSDIVPSDARNLGRSNTLRVRAPRLLQRLVEVHRRQRHPRILQIGNRDPLAGGEDSFGRRGAGSADEVDEVVGDESGSLDGESAEGDVGGYDVVRCEGAEDGESFGFAGSLEEERMSGCEGGRGGRLTSMLISSLKAPRTPVGILSTSQVVARMMTGKPLAFQPCRATAKHSRKIVDMAGSGRSRCQPWLPARPRGSRTLSRLERLALPR